MPELEKLLEKRATCPCECCAMLRQFAPVIAAGEAHYAKYLTNERADGEGKPEGTRGSLERVATMLETYGPDLFPANEQGQIHFARAMMDSAVGEIRAFLTATTQPQEKA